MTETPNYPGPVGSRATPLPKIGGALAVAGTFIGMAIFIGGCMGFNAVFALSFIPLILGGVGLVLTLMSGLFQERIAMDDPQVVAALVINLAVVLGALLEMSVWMNKPIFALSGGT